MKKSAKIRLTKGKHCDILFKHAKKGESGEKKVQKTLKKVLDKRVEVCYNNKVARKRGERVEREIRPHGEIIDN